MQENDKRALAELGDMKASAIGGDEAVLPWPLDEHRRGIVAHVRRSRFGAAGCGQRWVWSVEVVLDIQPPALMAAMVSWAFLIVRSGLPLTFLSALMPRSTKIVPTTRST